jgi:LysR family transcriptional regulator, regulator for genes of the gallate degradation pathway
MAKVDRVLSNFGYLRVFESVARLKSVSRASGDLGLTQPAVSQAIAKIEEALETRLFMRSATGCYLNEPGEVLCLRVNRFFEQMQEAIETLLQNEPHVDLHSVKRNLTGTHVRNVITLINESRTRSTNDNVISSASLKRSVRDLESLIQRKLILRTAAGITPTPEGKEFSRRLELALTELEFAVEEVKSASQSMVARIAIGCLPLANAGILARSVNELLSKRTTTKTLIYEAPYPSLLESLRSGTIDLIYGILRQSDETGDIVEETLFQDPYVIAVRRGHPLLQKSTIRKADLAEYDWIMASVGPRRRYFDDLFRNARCRVPSTMIETVSLTTQRAILMTSDRLSLLTVSEIQAENEDKGLVALPYSLPQIVRPHGVTTRANWQPTKTHLEFLEILRAHSA